jgi:hypothetical protein
VSKYSKYEPLKIKKWLLCSFFKTNFRFFSCPDKIKIEKVRKTQTNALGVRVNKNFNLFFLNPETVFKITGWRPDKAKISQNSNRLHSRLLFFKEKIILTWGTLSISKKFKVLCFEIKWCRVKFL